MPGAAGAVSAHADALLRRDDDTRADELVQDIWLRVLQGIGCLQEPAKLRAWLFGIAHRRVIDRLLRLTLGYLATRYPAFFRTRSRQ